MLKSSQWNVYTLLMVGLVPAMLLTAWGMDSWQSYRRHQLQCEVAVEWLEESRDIAPQFTQANTMNRTQLWISNVDEINSPAHASILRRGILQSANYHLEYFPEHPTDAPGVLNPKNSMFARDIEEGTAELINHCPETEALLPAAFPMIFPKEDTN